MTTERLEAVITVSDVTRSFPLRAAPALSHISLQVPRGEFLVLMGPSGSGKSTLLNLLGGLDSPTEGSIECFGQTLTNMGDRELTIYRRDFIGFVFQTFHLIPTLTAHENVLTPLMPRRRTIPKHQALELLSSVGLSGKERQLPGELSGGEQQRVALARALVTKPRLLLADEPTGNLDAATGNEVMELITGLHRATDLTIVLATHDPQVALRGDRVVALRDGRVASDVPVRPTDSSTDLTARVSEPSSEQRADQAD